MNKKNHSLALLFLLFMQASCGPHGAIKGMKHSHLGGSNKFESVRDEALSAYDLLMANKKYQSSMVDISNKKKVVKEVDDYLSRLANDNKGRMKSLLFLLELNNILNIYFDKFLQFECNEDCLTLPLNIKKTIKELTVDMPYFWHYSYISKNKSTEHLLNHLRKSMGFERVDFENLPQSPWILRALFSYISRKFAQYSSIDIECNELEYAQKAYGLNIYEYFSREISYSAKLNDSNLCELRQIITYNEPQIKLQEKIVQATRESKIHPLLIEYLIHESMCHRNLPLLKLIYKEIKLFDLMREDSISYKLNYPKRWWSEDIDLLNFVLDGDKKFEIIQSKVHSEKPFLNYPPRDISKFKSTVRRRNQRIIEKLCASDPKTRLINIDRKCLTSDQRFSIFLRLEWPYKKVEFDILLEILDWEYIFFQPARFHSTARKYSAPSQKFGLFQRLLSDWNFGGLCKFWKQKDLFNYVFNTRVVPSCCPLHDMITYNKNDIFSSTFRPVHLLEAIITSSIAENRLSHGDFIRRIINTYGIRSIISEKFDVFEVLNKLFKNGTKDERIFYKKTITKTKNYIIPHYCQIYLLKPPHVIIDLISRYIDN